MRKNEAGGTRIRVRGERYIDRKTGGEGKGEGERGRDGEIKIQIDRERRVSICVCVSMYVGERQSYARKKEGERIFPKRVAAISLSSSSASSRFVVFALMDQKSRHKCGENRPFSD